MVEINNIEYKDTRSGFGDALLEIGVSNEKVVALCADLTESVRMDKFAKKFADRFFQVGIAEANMISIAAGLATTGYIPFTGTFANFSTSRVYDQIRQSIAYSNKNVKICASHCGLTLGEDGATHQVLEDIGMMKMLPNMTVISPCDYNETKLATIAISKHIGPVYLRFGRPSVPNFSSINEDFIIGKAKILRNGNDVTIIATGHLVWEAIQAGIMLEKVGIDAEIINLHTIKPLDKECVLKSAKKTGCVVTAEEHQIYGGMGESISGFLSSVYPVPIAMVGVMDVFGESGTPMELLEKYHLKDVDIVNKAKYVLEKKIKNI